MSSKQKIVLLILVSGILILTGISTYAIIEKEIWVGIMAKNLMNNTVDVYFNNVNYIHRHINNETLDKTGDVGFHGVFRISGIIVNLKVKAVPINDSIERSFNLIQGSIFIISYPEHEFYISQSDGSEI